MVGRIALNQFEDENWKDNTWTGDLHVSLPRPWTLWELQKNPNNRQDPDPRIQYIQVRQSTETKVGQGTLLF